MRMILVAGARPNFVKIAPLMRAVHSYKDIEAILVHTGQHYDRAMSDSFFRDLEIPQPDVNLCVGSGSHAVQTAEVMKRFEPVLLQFMPDVVVVVGDVNSTIACALTAVKLGIRIAHVEAGLRSFDFSMPEEINRVLTDRISDYLFTTEPSAIENLSREGVGRERIFETGNVMVDSLLRSREKASQSDALQRLDLAEQPGGHALVTLHRPANVDDPDGLRRLFSALNEVAESVRVVFPAHPRTRIQVEKYDISPSPGILLIKPLGYLDFLHLMSTARLVLTDSGGVQEETTVLGVPCLTLRENTERPITTTVGTNQLMGSDPEKIVHHAREILAGRAPTGKVPPLWDGRAAERIIAILHRELSGAGESSGKQAAGPLAASATAFRIAADSRAARDPLKLGY
jgi:UDP-N-acetylglucosamine 2-epimerase (non-hydrolysing)